jgi:tetratricopeptide (TPR) repeat protein
VETSATAQATIDGEQWFAHTNHYLAAELQPLEANESAGSKIRLNRARQLLEAGLARGHDPRELAAELAGEAAARPPMILALDGLEAAYQEAWLADLLSILITYAPPALTLALSTRAPLPVDTANARLIKAADLAFTLDEAEAWLGSNDTTWQECFATTGGLPLALEVWRQHGANWPADLTARIMAAAPAHLFPEGYRGLVSEWLSGNLSLEAFAHQVSVGQPGAEQQWKAIGDIHFLMCDDPVAAKARLDTLWDEARGRGDRPLMGAVAMLEGEVSYTFGEFAQAMDWYRTAFAADPKLELTGSHSLVIMLRDLGRLEEAEALGKRCLEARRGWGDLSALCMAYLQLGQVYTELGQMAKAEECLLEAQRVSQKLAGNPAITLSAICYRAIMEFNRGNPATSASTPKRRTVWPRAATAACRRTAGRCWRAP